MRLRSVLLATAIVVGVAGSASATTGHGWWTFSSNHYSKKHSGTWGSSKVSYAWNGGHSSSWKSSGWSHTRFTGSKPRRDRFHRGTWGLFTEKSRYIGSWCPPEKETPVPPAPETSAVPVPMSAALLLPAFGLLAAAGKGRKKS